jgi:hypothetical protein
MVRLGCIVALCLALIAPAASASVQIAGNARGDQVLLDTPLGQLGKHSLYASSRAAGGAFGPLRPITPATASFGGYATVDDAGGALAIVRGTTFADYMPSPVSTQLFAAAPGGDLEPIADLENDPRWLITAGARGDAVLSRAGGFEDPGAYRFRPAGGDLGPSTPLPGTDISFSTMAVEPDGTAVYLWREFGKSPDPSRTFESTRPRDGDFGPASEVAGVPPNESLFAATAPNGRQLIVWPEEDGIDGVERAPGGHFGAPFAIARTRELFNIHSVSLADSGAAAVLFGDAKLYLAARDPGKAFAEPQRFAASRDHFATPTGAVDDRGDVAIAWFDPDHPRVLGSYRLAAGAADRARILGGARRPSPIEVRVPGLAIDASGRATVAWERSDGATIRTVVRDFDASTTSATTRLGKLPSFAREGAPGACRPTGASVLLSTPQATVFSQNGEWACLLARGAPVHLTHDPAERQPTAVSLAGPFVAYAVDYSGHSSDFTTIYVTDLRDPDSGLNRSAGLGKGIDDPVLVFTTRLKPNGAVAWVDQGEEPGRPVAVHAWNAHAAKPRLLDRGRRIAPRSLRLKGSRLTWRKRGKVRHATLR